MDLAINYLLVGIGVQLFMVWASYKIENEEFLFTPIERIGLTLLWPIVLVSVIYYTIKALFFEK
jgi:hypothetical protein